MMNAPWISLNGTAISLEPPLKTTSVRRLLAGRAWASSPQDLSPDSTPADLADIAARLRSLRDAVAQQFVARGEMAEAVTVALAAGEHVFVYGPPGTAKSSLLRLFAEGIGGKFWRIVLNPDITREDIVGPLDPTALKKGEWRRRWAGFATADLVFLDEVWKSSPQVGNTLLDGLEERRVVAGEDEQAIPLLSAMAASNEIPDTKETQAAYDRFLIRLSVSYLRDPDDVRSLLTADAGTSLITSNINTDEVRLLAAAAEMMALDPPQEVVDTLVTLWQQVGQNGRAVSDRRWRKTLKAACAAALLEGAPISPRHLGVARWTLWSEADEEADIRNVVLGLTDPVGSDVLDTEALLADLKNAAAGLAGMKLQERAEVAGKARKLVTRCDKLLADPVAKPYKARLDVAKAEANAVVAQVLDLMA
jgi:MoxR-like ATPase